MIYKLMNFQDQLASIGKFENGVQTMAIPISPDNTDYQAFKTAVLDQQPGNLVAEDGDSFSINSNPNDSILEDADGNVMTIDEAKAYVRTLP
jgi:hypothetical protein